MAPVKCYYLNCVHNNATKSVFRFPVKDEHRLQLWLKHSGNASLTKLPHEQLKQRYLCEEHFEPEDVLKHYARSRLMPTAVPRMFESFVSQSDEISSSEALKVETPQKVYMKECIYLQMQKNPSPSIPLLNATLHIDPVNDCTVFDSVDKLEIKQMKKEVESLKKRNKILRDKIRHLCSKYGRKKRKMIFLESLKFSSKAAKTMAAMQLRTSKSRKEWTKDEKDLCLSIYSKSRSAYMYMRKQGIVVVAPTTIRMWLGQTNSPTSLQKDV